jgi:hypothetical protein
MRCSIGKEYGEKKKNPSVAANKILYAPLRTYQSIIGKHQ